MKLIVLSNDEFDNVDRRIVCQAKVFVEHGWAVEIHLVVRSRKPATRVLETGITLHGRPLWMFPPPHDPLFHGTEGPTVQSAARSKLRVVSRYLTSTFSLARRVRMMFPTPAEYYPLPYTRGFLEQTADRPCDAVMACDLPALPAAAELSRRRGIPLIYDSHEYYAEQGTFSPRQRDVLIAHESRDIHQAALSYTVSDLIAEELTERYSLAKPVRVLYNAPAFDAAECAPDGSAIRRKLGVAEDATLLMFHGGFMRGRNLETLVTEFANLNAENSHLLLLGFGSETQSLRKLAKRAEGKITVHDAVPQDELPEWITAVDAVVIPYSPVNERNNELCMPNKFSDCVELDRPVIANSGLRMLHHFIERFDVGFTGPMNTPQTMRTTLGNALEWLRDDAPRQLGFADARRHLGADAQREKLRCWLGEIGLPGFIEHADEPRAPEFAA